MDIKLREWNVRDAESLAKILNNVKILDNLRDGLPLPYTEDDAAAFIEYALGSDSNKTFMFAVEHKGELVGNVGIYRQENIHFRTAELGYYIGENYWNKGIATEAVKQACDYVFENSDVMRIFAEPFARNKASCRVLEKAGFVFEGTLRAKAVKNGIVEDMRMYAKIKNCI